MTIRTRLERIERNAGVDPIPYLPPSDAEVSASRMELLQIINDNPPAPMISVTQLKAELAGELKRRDVTI